MNCPSSVHLSDGIEDKSSKFAEEGTLAHEVAETWLTGNMGPDCSDEMTTHVRTYVGYVNSLDGDLSVEQRVSVNDRIYGTADAVVWCEDEQHLHVIDLKYGAGVAVEIEGNLQLRIYALAALITFGHKAKRVTATIVQPRCYHADGPIRSITFDVVELLEFHAELLDSVDRVDAAVEQPVYSPSEKGCRWCKASFKCPALQTKAQTLAKQVFAPDLPYDPQALAETLGFLPILEGWIKNVREFAYGEVEQGRKVPGWKLVDKVARRKWRDLSDAHIYQKLCAASGLTMHDFQEPAAMKTPAAAEKLIPKDQRSIMEELTAKESSGHTLVHESDKRPAVVMTDAKTAFSESEN